MDTVPFENLRASMKFSEDKEKERDFLYQGLGDLSTVAHRTTFVMFDEILEDSPVQSRREVFNPDNNPKDRELLESIKASGIVTPIIVVPLEKQDVRSQRQFALVAGHRRVAAGKLTGLAGTTARVVPANVDPEAITLAENSGRKELSSFERAQALWSLKKRRKLSIRQVAEVTGLSKSYIGELFQANAAPEVLKSLWIEDSLSSKALVLLKDHWKEIGKKEISQVRDALTGLSQEGASSLAAHLNAGSPLETAISIVRGDKTDTSNREAAVLKGTKPTPRKQESMKKDDLVSAMREVFPALKEKQIQALFEYGIVAGSTDPEVLWAAALYVNQGGPLNKAVDLTLTAFKKKSNKILIGRKVKLVKQAASHLKINQKEDKTMREFLRVVLS